MDKINNENSAINIIKKTFQGSFDKDSFIYFIKNLLNHIDESSFIYKGNLIPDAYKSYIQSLERIGKYEDIKDDKSIDILVVHLKKNTSLERARTMQRNFIGWYLNGSRGGVLKDAALVAFVSPDSKDWRFSLVKMDYQIDNSKKKINVKQEFTPARRFSFLVGENESCHTAQSSLVPILVNDKENPTLEQLQKAFNIERVTKEFFGKYRDLFLELKESLDGIVSKDEKIKKDFKEKNVDTADFAKKLLGQIVFLYFLQKKGWFGVDRDSDWGTGPKNFLRLLFEKKIIDYNNFFNDILEPLFYEALRNDRSHDDHYFSYFKCKIPFLNGGLFDPINNYDWSKTDIFLSDKIFSNKEKTKEGDEGKGILDIFDRYNFTVKEDEPLEKEVAVDPEMLGKVFEYLLAVKDRKSKGTYYTPREIVHYMCQQSLINYLYTELKDKVKKEDIETLIKHGESVVEHDSAVEKKGKESKRYSFKLSEEIRKNAKFIDEKLSTIRVCDPAIGSGAFPVGMMSEIVRTRNVLTGYIKDKEDRSIYDFKRHAIQECLYGVDIDSGAVEIAKLRLWLSLVVDEEDIKQIKPLPNLDYKIVCGNSLIGIQKEMEGVENMFYSLTIKKLEKEKQLYFNETNIQKKQEYKERIDDLIKEITNGHKEFDFEVYFSEIFHEKKGFDVVIGNPPYVRQEEIDNKESLRQAYDVFDPVSDLYAYFYERGFQLLHDHGVLTFITSSKFLRAQYGFLLRKYLRINTTIKNIVNFGSQHMFEAITNTLIFIATKKSEEGNSLNYLDNINEIDKIEFPQDILQDREWTIERPEVIYLKNKIEGKGIPLKDWSIRMNRGILTGYNEAFVINEKIRDKIISKNASAIEIIKPIIRGRDIKRYYFLESDLYLINVHNGYKKTKGSIVDAVDIESYPAIKAHLDQYRKKLEARQDKGKTIYNLRDCAFIQDFSKEKIIWIELTNENRFSYSDKEDYLLAGAFFMVGESLKYLLSFLNSKLCHFYFSLICNSSGMATIQWKKFALEKIPVIKISNVKQKPFIKFVDKILNITKDDDYLQNEIKQKKVKEYEQKIDQLVYKLYGLTKEEIKIVENSK
ncbi:MAG: TaqI-like C-terminal specificity domain-containing protein [Candidatus Nealsonbacteria bacterium]